MSKHEYFNREISWLSFNQRVLEEAKDPTKPLLERLKFLAITASNLDEFFMVRVGGLEMARQAGRRKKDIAGLTPLMQLTLIRERTQRMMKELHRCFYHDVEPALNQSGIGHLNIHSMTHSQEREAERYFQQEVFPIITPLGIRSDSQSLNLENMALHMLIALEPLKGKKDRVHAILPLHRSLERIVKLTSEEGISYLLIEELVQKYCHAWFPGFRVIESGSFRITRNANFAVAEEEAPDLLAGMEEILEERKIGSCVRLELDASMSSSLQAILRKQVPAAEDTCYSIKGTLNLKDLMSMAFVEGFDELKIDPWSPQQPADIVPNQAMFEQIRERDHLFYHPYESFDPVLRWIEEAAVDTDVLSIKMVLYRTSSDSAIVEALKRAALSGKQVTVLIELKARFDEAQNIEWAREMEMSGVQVIHGVRGYKTHAKVTLVVRREETGIVRYCHYGTGNYNESTAKLYGDISYLTCHPELGEDASMFFNVLCGYAQPERMNHVSMAPLSLRERILELIEFEISRAKQGKKAAVYVKMNSLVDMAISEALYKADRAGVQVVLNIRGICCLKPRGSIRVISIVDRYLEHARIIEFYHGGKPLVYISSADWMPRNLDRRLELLVPVIDAECRTKLRKYLDIHMQDNQRAWGLQADGSYRRVLPKKGARKVRSQAWLQKQMQHQLTQKRKDKPTRFQPHMGSNKTET